MNSKICKKVVKLMSEAYKILIDGLTFPKCKQWLKYGKRKIRLLKEYLNINKNTLSVSRKCSIASSIAILTELNRKMNNLQKKKKEEGVSAANRQRDRISWEEIENALRDRTTIDSDVNLKHFAKILF